MCREHQSFVKQHIYLKNAEPKLLKLLEVYVRKTCVYILKSSNTSRLALTIRMHSGDSLWFKIKCRPSNALSNTSIRAKSFHALIISWNSVLIFVKVITDFPKYLLNIFAQSIFNICTSNFIRTINLWLAVLTCVVYPGPGCPCNSAVLFISNISQLFLRFII